MKSAEKVQLRNDFYKEAYRNSVLISTCLVVIVVASIIANIYFFTNKEAPKYFYVDNQGRVVQASPVSEPYVSQDFLLNWATKAASKSFTLNAKDYRDQIQELRAFFTDEGYAQFQNSLDVSKQLEFITANSLMTGAVPLSVPVIVNEGVVNGFYAWKVRFPMRVTYTSGKQTLDKTFALTMVIVRRPTTESYYGIGINQFIFREGNQ